MTAKKTPTYKYELSWLTFAKAFWDGRFWAIGIAVLIASLGIVKVSKMPAIYRAEALVLVDTQKIPERFVSSTVTADVQDRLTTISQEILSSTRLSSIIKDFHLYREERKTHVQDEVVELMRKNIEIKVEKLGGGNRPGAFRISYESKDPAVTAQVTNRIANLYIEENLRTREIQAETTSEFIENQLQDSKKQLNELEISVSKYKLQHNGELPQQENSLASTLGRLQTELTGVQDAINRAQQMKLVMQNSLANAENAERLLVRQSQISRRNVNPELPFAAQPADPARPLLRSEQLSAELAGLRTKYSDEHPQIRRILTEIERVRAAEGSRGLEGSRGVEGARAAPVEKGKTSAGATPAPPVDFVENAAMAAQITEARDRTANLKHQIAMLDREADNRQTDRTRILREISFSSARMDRLPLREQEMAGLTRDYEISKANYRSLLDKKIAADMAGDLERRQKAEKFTILDPARIPEKAAKPNRPVLYGMSILAGLLIGSVFAVGKGLMHDTLLGEWELPKEITLLGRVPHIDVADPGKVTGGNEGKPRWRLASLAVLAAGIGAQAASLLGESLAGLRG